jgi:hypothetical protein
MSLKSNRLLKTTGGQRQSENSTLRFRCNAAQLAKAQSVRVNDQVRHRIEFTGFF